jgi:hypothetical protein
MTKTEQTPYERALVRAAQDGVQVVEDLGDHWQVRGSDGVTRYTVQTTADGLRCTCPSRYYCKHLAVCQQRLNELQAERERIAAEASVALTPVRPASARWPDRRTARKCACGHWHACPWRLRPMPLSWDQPTPGSGTRPKRRSGKNTRLAAYHNAGIN